MHNDKNEKTHNKHIKPLTEFKMKTKYKNNYELKIVIIKLY